MLPDITELDPTPDPFEMLEMDSGEQISLKPLSFSLGRAKITPRDGRPAREIRILRVDVSLDDKPTLPQYWDVTSAHLIAALYAHFSIDGYQSKVYKITKVGEGPRARFTLDVT